MIIKTIELSGFEGHVDSVIDLVNGLNVITGPSGNGKTSIIRAVRWVAFNEPTGDAYVNQGMEGARVTLILENGETVTKTRRKGKTAYKLGSIEEPFEKAEVPLEVKQALGILKQSFGDFETELNFSFQLAAPFLLSETASAGAKILGKLAGTEAVDVAIKDVSKDTYSARQEKTQADREIERIDGQLGQFHNLHELKEDLAVCEAEIERLEAGVKKVDDLRNVVIRHNQLRDQLDVYHRRLDALVHVPDLEVDLQNLEQAQQRYEAIGKLYQQFERAKLQLREASDVLYKTDHVDEMGNLLEQVKANQYRQQQLKIAAVRHESYTDDAYKAKEVLDKLSHVEDAQRLTGTLEQNFERSQKIKVLQKSWFECLADIGRAASNESIYQQFIEQAENLIPGVEEKQQRKDQLRLLYIQYRNNYRVAEQRKWDANQAAANVQKAERELSDAWEAVGGVCPLCEEPLNGGHVHG